MGSLTPWRGQVDVCDEVGSFARRLRSECCIEAGRFVSAIHKICESTFSTAPVVQHHTSNPRTDTYSQENHVQAQSWLLESSTRVR